MLIDRYDRSGYAEAQWWVNRLKRADRGKLREALDLYTDEKIALFDNEIDAAVDELLAHPPHRRDAVLRRRGRTDFHFHVLLLLACQRARDASLLLEHLSNQAVDPSVEIHPREMFRRAARAAMAVRQHTSPLWPFDDGETRFHDPSPA